MVRGHFQIDIVKRLSLAVPGIQVFDLESNTHKLCRSERAAPNRVPHGGDRAYDEKDEDKRYRPSLAMPVIVGGVGVHIDLQRQGRRGLIVAKIPERVAQRSEQ